MHFLVSGKCFIKTQILPTRNNVISLVAGRNVSVMSKWWTKSYMSSNMFCETFGNIWDDKEIQEQWKQRYLAKEIKKEILGDAQTIDELYVSHYKGRPSWSIQWC